MTKRSAAADRRACPHCGAAMPAEAGICPVCTYMIPLSELPRSTSRRKIDRREVVVNLLPHRLRWDPAGLETARRLATQALHEASVDGWEPASLVEPCRLMAGRTISGAVVERAVLTLERLS